MAENNQMQEMGLDLAKTFGIDVSKIKGEIQEEIHTGILKAFVAGMLAVVIGNWVYSNWVK